MRMEISRSEDQGIAQDLPLLPAPPEKPARLTLNDDLAFGPIRGETRTFQIDLTKLKAAAAALVLSSAIGAEAKASEPKYPTKEARWLADTSRKDEALEAAGALKRGVSHPADDGGLAKKVAIGTLLAGVMAFGVKKVREAGEQADLQAEREGLMAGLGSEFAGVRQAALEAMKARPDLARFDLGPVYLAAVRDRDKGVRMAAEAVLVAHPGTTEATLKLLSLSGSILKIRAEALDRLHQLKFQEKV